MKWLSWTQISCTQVSWIQRLSMIFQISFSWLAIKHVISTVPLPVLAHQLGAIQNRIWTFLRPNLIRGQWRVKTVKQPLVSSTLNQTRTSRLLNLTASKNNSLSELKRTTTFTITHVTTTNYCPSSEAFQQLQSQCYILCLMTLPS